MSPAERKRCQRYIDARHGHPIDVVAGWYSCEDTGEFAAWWVAKIDREHSRAGQVAERGNVGAWGLHLDELAGLEVGQGGTGTNGLPIVTARLGDALLDPADVADLLGVERATVWQWVKRGHLPAPARRFGACPAWWLSDVESWARSTGRLDLGA